MGGFGCASQCRVNATGDEMKAVPPAMTMEGRDVVSEDEGYRPTAKGPRTGPNMLRPSIQAPILAKPLGGEVVIRAGGAGAGRRACCETRGW